MTTFSTRLLLGLVLMISAAGGVRAQDALSGVQQSEWAESFDTQSSLARPVATVDADPVAADRAGDGAAIYAYQDLVARGGWNTVPSDKALKLGMRDPNVAISARAG